MKKKNIVSSKDQKDWNSFTKKLNGVYDKDSDLIKLNYKKFKTKKLDLHGLSLVEANKETKKFILKSLDSGYKKLLIITGKGSRSKVYSNPYLSKEMNTLKHSVPEFIRNDEDLSDKIYKITESEIKDGGKGALWVFLN